MSMKAPTYLFVLTLGRMKGRGMKEKDEDDAEGDNLNYKNFSFTVAKRGYHLVS